MLVQANQAYRKKKKTNYAESGKLLKVLFWFISDINTGLINNNSYIDGRCNVAYENGYSKNASPLSGKNT